MHPPEGPAWNLLVLLVVIAIGPFVAERLRLPGIIGLLIGGFLIGEHGLALLTSDEFVAIIGELGLLYLMFLAGAELDLVVFARLRRNAVVLGILTFSLPFALGYLTARWLEFDPLASVLIGSLWASHTLVTYPVMRRYGLTTDPAVAVSVGATVITDTLALMVLAVVAKAHVAGTVGLDTLVSLAIGLGVLALAAFIVVPRIGRWFFAGLGQERTLRFVYVLAAIYGLASLALVAGIEGIIGAFFAGLGLNRLIPHGSPLAERVEFFGSALFVPAFLVSVGLVIDPAVLTQPATIRMAAVFLFAVFVGKAAASIIGARLFGFSGAQAGVMFALMLSQAAATLAAATVGVDIGLIGTDVLNAVIVVMIVTLFVASVAANRFAARVPPATDVAADIARTIVVPLDDPAMASRVLPGIARIAGTVGGLVVPIHVTTPEETLATARATAAAIDTAAAAAGIETESSLRVAVSIGQGVRNAVTEAGGTLLVLARPHGLAAQDVVFGGIDAEFIAGSHVPTVLYFPGDAHLQRVVLPLRRRDLSPEGMVDARIAMELARRLEASRLGLLVGVGDGATMPADLVPPAEAELATFTGGRVGWLRGVARPGDIVLLPAALESLVIGLDAARLASIDGITVVVVAGPFRSGVYGGHHETIASLETSTIT